MSVGNGCIPRSRSLPLYYTLVTTTDGEDTAIVMVDERELLRTAGGVEKVESWWYPYSLQMILKLLASSLVVRNALDRALWPMSIRCFEGSCLINSFCERQKALFLLTRTTVG